MKNTEMFCIFLITLTVVETGAGFTQDLGHTRHHQKEACDCHHAQVKEIFKSEMRELKHEIVKIHKQQKGMFLIGEKLDNVSNIEERISKLEEKFSFIDKLANAHEVIEGDPGQTERNDLFDPKLMELLSKKRLSEMLTPFIEQKFEELKADIQKKIDQKLRNDIKQDILNALETDNQLGNNVHSSVSSKTKTDSSLNHASENEKGMENTNEHKEYRKSQLQNDEFRVRRRRQKTKQALKTKVVKNAVILQNHSEFLKTHTEQLYNLENNFNITVSNIEEKITTNIGTQVKAIEHEIDTLASRYQSLHEIAITKHDVKPLILSESDSIVEHVSEKIRAPIRVEIEHVNKKIDDVSDKHTNQEQNQINIQHKIAELVEKIHFIEKNISSLSNQLMVKDESNVHDLSKQIQVKTSDLENELKDFMINTKSILPNILTNLSLIHGQHINDIKAIKNNIHQVENVCDKCAEFNNKNVSFKDIEIDMEETKSSLVQFDNDLKLVLEKVSSFQNDITESYDVMTHFQNNLLEIKDKVASLEAAESERALENDQWVKYNFRHSVRRNGCKNGEKYVKRTKYQSGKYVGVVLCSSTRYKIFLSDKLTEMFWDIGDSKQHGEDHCEFVGAEQHTEPTIGSGFHSYQIRGYTRKNWGQIPRLTTLPYYRPAPLWYECGVSIP